VVLECFSYFASQNQRSSGPFRILESERSEWGTKCVSCLPHSIPDHHKKSLIIRIRGVFIYEAFFIFVSWHKHTVSSRYAPVFDHDGDVFSNLAVYL